jgi:hypothetical protein
MKLSRIAVLGPTLLVSLSGAAQAASPRSTSYPFGCEGTGAPLSDRVCFYFAMRAAFGDGGLGLYRTSWHEGYADPRRFVRVLRVHRH